MLAILTGFAVSCAVTVSAWSVYVFLRTSDWHEDKMKRMTATQKSLRWYGLGVIVASIVGILWLIGRGVMR